MAHSYRIFDLRDAVAGSSGGLTVPRRRQHLGDRGHQRFRGQRPHELCTALTHNAIRDLPLIAATRHHHHWYPGQQRLRHHTVPAAADHQIGVRQQFVLSAETDHRPRRHLDLGSASRDTTTLAPSGSISPGRNASSATSVSPRAPITAVDGATTTTGPGPGGTGRHRRQSARSAGVPPPRPRTASPGAAPPTRAGSRSGAAAGRDRLRANRFRPGPPNAGAGPPATTGAVNARMTVSRRRPRSPTPGASPLPTGGRPFDGRYSGDGHNSTHGRPINSAAKPPHAVITSDTTRSGARSRSRGTFSTAIRAARWWIFAPASVSSSAAVGSSPSSSTASTPAPRAVSSHSVPVSSVGVSPAARNRRHSAMAGNACPGSGPATTATRTGLPCHSACLLRWQP